MKLKKLIALLFIGLNFQLSELATAGDADKAALKALLQKPIEESGILGVWQYDVAALGDISSGSTLPIPELKAFVVITPTAIFRMHFNGPASVVVSSPLVIDAATQTLDCKKSSHESINVEGSGASAGIQEGKATYMLEDSDNKLHIIVSEIAKATHFRVQPAIVRTLLDAH